MTLILDHAPGFTGSTLDRLDHVRGDPNALAAFRSDPRAQLLEMRGIDPVLDEGSGRLGWRALAELPADAEVAFLGMFEGAPRFVLLDFAARGSGFSADLRGAITLLTAPDAALYAAARSLVDWHARHGFCARCGSRTESFRAGWARRCADCRSDHWPRTDPVVIMLAEHEGRVLVGRQPSWPVGNYSALAGFVEVGESIEEAVARELAEEAGVRASRVRYVASQPWPFPSSLMIACVAEVEQAALDLDLEELEHAMWVTRDEVRQALAAAAEAPFQCPPPYAIAHTLLRAWHDGA